MSHAIKPPKIGNSFKLFLLSSAVSIVGAKANIEDLSWGMPVYLIGTAMFVVSIGMAVAEMYDDT